MFLPMGISSYVSIVKLEVRLSTLTMPILEQRQVASSSVQHDSDPDLPGSVGLRA